MNTTRRKWPLLVRNLLDEKAYDHPVDAFDVIETHISYVILAGEFVYKIKKPVDLGFVDFSTLEKRRFYCQEELRLNRRLAPGLYLGVSTVRGSEQKPHIGGEGPVLEYAVKMRRFDEACQLDRYVAQRTPSSEAVEDFARQLARFHGRAERAPARSNYGGSHLQQQQMADNIERTRDYAHNCGYADEHTQIQAWSESMLASLAPIFVQRRKAGFVRECHGDLHLGNLALIDGRITAFDCLEFNPQLRWIDVVSEIAFLDMDLRRHRLDGLANHFLNGYLEHSGDYAGMVTLTYFRVYRAMVRAKVACLQCERDTQAAARFTEHIELAWGFAGRSGNGCLVITHGLSGSGKTTLTGELLRHVDAIRIRSDVERQRLFADRGNDAGPDRYSPTAVARTYRYLTATAEPLLKAGHTVVLDATFLARAQRSRAQRLAAQLSVPFVILDIRAAQDTLRARVAARARAGRDASEADLAVLDAQIKQVDALTEIERDAAITVDTGAPVAFNRLARDLADRGCW